jgi:PTS system glucitol/sorbitol-specific IIA component
VINFNGATETERPGEICASAVDPEELVAELKAGAVIVLAAA